MSPFDPNEFATANWNLVRAVAIRWTRKEDPPLDYRDFISVGIMALIRRRCDYDASKGTWTTFAQNVAASAIRHEIRDRYRLNTQNNDTFWYRIAALEARLEREATDDEICEHMDVSSDELISRRINRRVDQPLLDYVDYNDCESLEDTVMGNLSGDVIMEAIKKLKPLQQEAVLSHLELGTTDMRDDKLRWHRGKGLERLRFFLRDSGLKVLV